MDFINRKFEFEGMLFWGLSSSYHHYLSDYCCELHLSKSVWIGDKKYFGKYER